VCPSLLPLSKVALRNYEAESREALKAWLGDIQMLNSRVGLQYNLFPLKEQGIDYAQAVTLGDFVNEAEEKIN
jgi:hypothetical protein